MNRVESKLGGWWSLPFVGQSEGPKVSCKALLHLGNKAHLEIYHLDPEHYWIWPWKSLESLILVRHPLWWPSSSWSSWSRVFLMARVLGIYIWVHALSYAPMYIPLCEEGSLIEVVLRSVHGRVQWVLLTVPRSWLLRLAWWDLHWSAPWSLQRLIGSLMPLLWRFAHSLSH